MIRNRPEIHLRSVPHYEGLPSPPYALALDAIPDLIKLALFPLRHVEPLTSDMFSEMSDVIEDIPDDDEFSFYSKADAKFQLISVVINSIYQNSIDGVSYLRPYSISLIPASKRGEVQVSKTPFVKAMCGKSMFDEGVAYLGLDPFSGDWELFSDVNLIAEMGSKSAYTDELGLIYDYFFLRTDIERDSIVQPALDMPESRLKNYLRHRAKLLYTPFAKLKSRQIWGVENALELFVFQELSRKSAPVPIPQAHIFNDGSWHPSLYHAWQTFDESSQIDLISEVDFFFPESKLALFCDGATHNRATVKARDRRIDQALQDLGIKSVRVNSGQILRDVENALDDVVQTVC